MGKEDGKYTVTPEERALIERATSGNQEAFEELYKNNFRFILFYTRRFFADENGYEDIVQEVVMDMYKGLGTLKDPDKFRSWLYILIRNVCIKHIKREKKTESYDDGQDETVLLMAETRREYIPEDNLQKTETDSIVADAVGQLPAGYQNVVRMYYYEEKNYQEIAEELQINVKTVGSNLTKAKRLLKEMLENGKMNIDDVISHALLIEGADATLSGVDATHLMHLCDAKIAGTLVAHVGSGASAAAGSVAGAVVSVKVVIAVVACVLVTAGGGAAIHFTNNDAPVPESQAAVTEPLNVDASIELSPSDEALPEGVNPAFAELANNSGDAEIWQVKAEDGTVVSSGSGGKIDFGEMDLEPGNYSIFWAITGEDWEATAERDIVIF
ncbi:MAG: sigma-70 family RNA polymerase sigma factor [Clostridiales Family XIII bacterium]|nr:sigma-70 family RNA polymerase sigma factor [Clostridiales Family XIII bacterium]